ncbi:MAG: type I-E CRISPR-associated protein Cas7/Cse4/CasC [bacterium]
MENLQIHFLNSLPPSNPNRDDLGRPKTAIMGGVERQRISSQCLKRSWRTSDTFWETVGDNQSIRTKKIGRAIEKSLVEGYSLSDFLSEDNPESVRSPVDEDTAESWAISIAGQFGDLDDGHELSTVAMVTPEEIDAIDNHLESIAAGNEPDEDDISVLRESSRAIDTNLFGRMVADNAQFSIGGTMQVGHALTTHGITVESDYFTAVDELNTGEETGSGHIDNRDFSSGVFYGFAALNLERLRDELGEKLYKYNYPEAMAAFLRSMLTVTPSGFKNSFGSSGYSEYAVVEHSTDQPRNLASTAFGQPVTGNYLENSIERLDETLGRFDEAYDPPAKRKSLNLISGDGSLDNLESFVRNSVSEGL